MTLLGLNKAGVKKMDLSFHQNFRLERNNIAKILKCIKDNPTITNVEIYEATGIGIGKDPQHGKVLPTILYSLYGGLIMKEQVDGQRHLKLSDVGEIVFDNDSYLRKRVSHWVMHYHLSRMDSDAEAWAFFIHEFLQHHGSFTRKELEAALAEKFEGKATVKSINPGVLLSCYIDEENALGKLRLLRERKRGEYFRATPNIPNAYLVGYLLAEIWDRQHPTSTTVSSASLLKTGHLAPTLGVDEVSLQEQLDEMTALGIIEQMRAVAPFQVVKLWNDKLELLKAAYDELEF